MQDLREPTDAARRLVAPIVLAIVLLAVLLRAPGDLTHRGPTALHLVVALAVILAASQALGAACGLLRQPRVVGEMAVGLLLGPMLLGRLAPTLSAAVFPAEVRPALGLVAQVCVLLYMFLVGAEFDAARLRQHSRAAVAISQASIAVPFALGFALALGLRSTVGATAAPAWVFALFLGVAMSVTAFPVLARVVDECGLRGTTLGTLAMTCAAIGDATAWGLLAAVVSTARPDALGVLAVLSRVALYAVIAYGALRPLARALATAWEPRGRGAWWVLPVVFAMLASSAWATDAAGIHPIFGAFTAGMLVPSDSRLARDLHAGLGGAVALLLPTFFAAAGLRMPAGTLGTGALGGLVLLVIAAATVGKVGGTAIAARATGLGWRDATALGFLMNTRGLMELVVLQVGLDLGILPPALFSVMVVMALATTVMTTPIVRAMLRPAA